MTADYSLALPALVGPYELLLRLGSGGMASVYLARLRGEAGFARAYAVKLIHPWLAEQRELVDMLMDEAKIASRLAHPNVVATLDLGRDAHGYYMAMEYVDGVALDRLLARSPEHRPPELIVGIAIDVLHGLQAAHELCDVEGRPLELVHRDVTPGNVMVTVDGTALIADFGVAKARARITKTNPGIVKGKAGYVAPEVVLGQSIDPRADVFSMGVLLWNALTGTTLFETDNIASSVMALMRGNVPAPSTVGLMPPPIFDHAILAALHRDPQHRHASAYDMAEALSDALAMYGRGSEPARIGAWVSSRFGPELERMREMTAPELDEPGLRTDETRPLRHQREDHDTTTSDAFPPMEGSMEPPTTAHVRRMPEEQPKRARWIAFALLAALLAVASGSALGYFLFALDGDLSRLEALVEDLRARR